MSTEYDWSRVRKQTTRSAKPKLSIYTDGTGRFNAAAMEDLFDGADDVDIYEDADQQAIGFEAADEVTSDTYSLTTSVESAGAEVRLKTPLRAIGVDVDELGETHFVTLDEHGDIIVADLSTLADGAGVETDQPVRSEDTGSEQSGDGRDDSADDPEHVAEEDNGAQASVEDSTEVKQAAEEEKETTATDDVPLLEDADDPTTEEKVSAFLNRELSTGGTLETTCGEIGDAVDEDGRAIPHALKSLDEYEAEKTDKADDGEAAIWAIRRAGEDESDDPEAAGTTASETDASDDSVDELDAAINDVLGDSDGLEEPDADDVRYWCGFCGQGPFRRGSQVEGHHNRNDHPGEYVPRTSDPAEEQLLDGDGPETTADRSLTPYQRVAEWFETNVPEYTYWKTEDVAIECDIKGNEARDALETLSEDLEDYVIEHDGRLWRVRAPTGGDA